MHRTRPLLFACLFLISLQVSAYQVSGIIKDAEGPLAYVGIYVKGSTYGVVSNLKGEYFIELEKGTYILVFQSIGHATVEKTIQVEGNTLLDVTMFVVEEILAEYVVDKNREDPAYGIIRKVIANKSKVNQNLSTFACKMYIKSSLEMENLRLPDTTNNDIVTRKKVNLVESWSDVYYMKPNQYKEVKLAYRNFADQISQSVSVSFSNQGNSGFQSVQITNPNLFFMSINDGVFDFYKNQMNLSVISDIPYTSPIADNAFKHYSYKLMESFFEGSSLVYKIRISHDQNANALFSGTMYVYDSTFTISAVELVLNPASLRYFSHFTVIQNYTKIDNGFTFPFRQDFSYETKLTKNQTNIGNTLVHYQAYETNPRLDKKFMRNGLVVFDNDSYDKDEEFWSNIRPVTLKSIENQYIKTQDSIIAFHKSTPYILQQDSIINHLKFWDFVLNGIQHQNTQKGYKWTFYPFLQQFRINLVDGYRHTLGGSYTKSWKNEEEIEFSGFINYGFLNENFRGEISVRYMYNPLKFERIRLKYNNIYTMINTNNSIRGTLSPSNYSDNMGFGIGHEKEWFNGFLLKAYMDYNQFNPYDGKILEGLWEKLPNFRKTQYFEAFEELVLKFSARITFRQQYEMRPNKKVILGSKYPVVTINYNKGIGELLQSDVNFDYLEMNADKDFRFGKAGVSRFNFQSGRYLNDKAVRLSNLRYFRGSDPFFFSNALKTMQLIDEKGLQTSKTFVQLNYIHHFNRTILGNVNFFNRLGIQLAVGGGALWLEETNLAHVESFVGLERPFRIFGQVFSFGSYYVVSTSNLNGASGGIKFAINVYEAGSRKWAF